LQLTLKGGVESMLLHYCPEVKSVEEVVNSEIEEVNKIFILFLLSRFFMQLQASNSQLKFVEEMTGASGT
jgi:hypothetical protein